MDKGIALRMGNRVIRCRDVLARFLHVPAAGFIKPNVTDFLRFDSPKQCHSDLPAFDAVILAEHEGVASAKGVALHISPHDHSRRGAGP